MPKTILIVDGNSERRGRLEVLVSGFGYATLAAAGTAEALKLAAEAAPNAVIAGSRFPDEDVDVLVRAIARRFRDLEVLVLVDESWVLEELKPLVAGFLVEPFPPEALEVMLARACERGWQRRRLRELPREVTRRVERRCRQQLETERFITVKQIVDKLSTFIGRIARDVEGGVRYFNEMPYFVAIHDREGRVLAANRVYRTLLGRRVGDQSWTIYDGPSADPEHCPVGRTIRTAAAQTGRETLCYRSGARVPVIVHTAPIYNNDGEIELVLEVSAGTRDVDQLKSELQTTQQRYQLLFDAVPCCVAVLDRDLRVATGNRQFACEFGERPGVGFRELFMVEDEAFAGSPVSRTLRDGGSHHGEMVLTGPSGRRYHMLAWTAPMSTAAGKLVQVMLILMDITPLRELQSNLASLGLMIGSISHSIKGVLTGLDAGVYLLKKGILGRDEPQMQSGLEIVRSIAERIRKMVMDILFYAKERELQLELVDVRGMAEDLARTVRPYLASKGVALDCVFEDRMGMFEVDPAMLRSAVINLLENAADACAAAGESEPRRVSFGVEANADTVGILVADTGIGMTPEQLKSLFTLFFSTKGSKGTGLGLFITDRIVRQHGGTITVDSAVGRGSRFGIVLPRRRAGRGA
jgi:signal transduction histidine kinase/CheY-like chemotaxis protein